MTILHKLRCCPTSPPSSIDAGSSFSPQAITRTFENFTGFGHAFLNSMTTIISYESPSLAIVSGILFFGAYLFYRWLLPKPITGIPHNAKATRSIFGDIPDMLEHLKHSKSFTDWLENQVQIKLVSCLSCADSVTESCPQLANHPGLFQIIQ